MLRRESGRLCQESTWLNDALDRLAAMPCGYHAGDPNAAEPVALSALALLGANRQDEAQKPFALVGKHSTHLRMAAFRRTLILTWPGWPTPLAIIVGPPLIANKSTTENQPMRIPLLPASLKPNNGLWRPKVKPFQNLPNSDTTACWLVGPGSWEHTRGRSQPRGRCWRSKRWACKTIREPGKQSECWSIACCPRAAATTAIRTCLGSNCEPTLNRRDSRCWLWPGSKSMTYGLRYSLQYFRLQSVGRNDAHLAELRSAWADGPRSNRPPMPPDGWKPPIAAPLSAMRRP